jgi:AcrR family transcriptional regulator
MRGPAKVAEDVMATTAKKIGSSAERLLKVTEALCAEHGLESVSMRDIAKAAGVSPSVIYHHYESRIDLLMAVFRQRFGMLLALRAPLVAELEAQAVPDVDKFLYSIMAPIAFMRSKGEDGAMASRFIARALMSSLPEIKAEVDEGIRGMRETVDIAQRAFPHLSREEICWRLHFTFGVEHMTHWDNERLEIMSDGLCNARSVEESITRAVAFAKAAFLAP